MSEMRFNNKIKIKTGDTVKILLGKDRGKTGKVMAVLAADMRVLVEGTNMIKKHVKPKRAGEKGQRVSVASTMDISNVQLICPSCKKASRVGVKVTNGKRIRICKKCEAEI